MKSTATEIEAKVDELLSCLDKDSQHIQESLSQLNRLRSLVIKRDDVSSATMPLWANCLRSSRPSRTATEATNQNVKRYEKNWRMLSGVIQSK